MTTIADRTVLVTMLDEGPVIGLDAPFPAAESFRAVDLTASAIEAAGGQPVQRGRACAIQLDLLHLLSDGTTDGLPLGSYSTVGVELTGDAGTVIPAGSRIKAAAGEVFWAITEDATIEEGGEVHTVAACLTIGAQTVAAHDLDTIVDPIDGWDAVDNGGATLTVGAMLAIQLKLYDRRTHGVAHRRTTADTLVQDGDVYQIESDLDQHSRLDDEPGNAGRLVIRWAAADLVLPPAGRWDWELIVSHTIGDATIAAGVIEVLS
jgi:hypothetical protein